MGFLVLGLFAVTLSAADTPDDDDSWNDIASDEKSLVFGRFVGKFNSRHFRSRKVRLREVTTGKVEVLEIGDTLGHIAETIPPGIYDMLGFEAIYYAPTTRPIKLHRYRPIRQRFAVNPKSGDPRTSRILVPKDRPVYIGTIQTDNSPDGIVYRGHRLRIIDDFQESYQRLSRSFPTLVGSLERQGIVPARYFMLKPARVPGPLERVAGLDDPIKQAREYIGDGKYRQALTWLDTFIPASDEEPRWWRGISGGRRVKKLIRLPDSSVSTSECCRRFGRSLDTRASPSPRQCDRSPTIGSITREASRPPRTRPPKPLCGSAFEFIDPTGF